MNEWLTGDNRRVKELHRAVFRRQSGYIPLGVSLRSLFSVNEWGYFLDYRAMFDHEVEKAEAVRAIGSDMIPTVVLRFDHVVTPSMFGAQVEEIGGFPWVKPCLTLQDVPRLSVPPLDSGIVARVAEAIEYFRRNLPEGLVICTPPETAPIEVAVGLFGSEFFAGFYTDPEIVRRALEVLTENFIQVSRHFKSLLQEPEQEKVTYLGTWIPGIRVAADSIVNLSPDMIRHFINPTWERIAEELGGVFVHYCPSPAEKYFHVIAPTLECPGVIGIDQSGGVEYLESTDNPERLAENTTFAAEAAFRRPGTEEAVDRATNINRLRRLDWADIPSWLTGEFVQLSRRMNRGLILRARVDSIEEGRELYGLWRELMGA